MTNKYKLDKQQLADWQNAMQDVKELKNKNSHIKESEFLYTAEMHFSKLKYTSEVIYTSTILGKDERSENDFKTKHALTANDNIKSARKSVDYKTQLKLKNGDMKYQDRIDLHGKTLQQASQELAYFLNASQHRGLKCVLVIHGKGANTQSQIGQIKQQIHHWLEQLDCVLSFTSALPKHGGTGAMYVLLRKK